MAHYHGRIRTDGCIQQRILPLLTPIWEDHELNDISFLKADTFSWQNGEVYKAVYQHLESDIFGKTLTSETISGVTIQYYLANDGHKICPVSEIANLESLFSNTGTAYYFVVDIENGRFKLPRKTFQNMKLYFYVGNFTQTAIEQTAGYAQELTEKKADKNLANSTAITNCITEIPQDIKLELNNGTLTLKAGSKVYVPNGARVFDVVTIGNDISVSGASSSPGAVRMLYYLGNNNIAVFGANSSGTTPPPSGTNQIFYNTSDNTIKRYTNGSAVASGYSLPLALIKDNGTYLHGNIDQVFNGFGYIGSTVFALPGVKGLIPNGRNADASLRNIEYNRTAVRVDTFGLKAYTGPFNLYSFQSYNVFQAIQNYDEKTNTMVGTYAGSFISGVGYLTNGVITSFTPKTAFHALDYNDKSTISGWSMPSGRYDDLTLLASGSTYTTPANGYYVFSKYSTAANQYYGVINTNNGMRFEGRSVNTGSLYGGVVQAKKNDVIQVAYGLAGATEIFRFIYAEGETNV